MVDRDGRDDWDTDGVGCRWDGGVKTIHVAVRRVRQWLGRGTIDWLLLLPNPVLVVPDRGLPGACGTTSASVEGEKLRRATTPTTTTAHDDHRNPAEIVGIMKQAVCRRRVGGVSEVFDTIVR